MGLFSAENSYLGIDIGNSSIKIVELSKRGGRPQLVTYGFSEQAGEKMKIDWSEDPGQTSYIIDKIIHDAGVKTRSGVSALPMFSVFSSILNLANVTTKDLTAAVHWEAKKVIPLPLEDMVLDWREIDASASQDKANKNIKVLLTGAPKAVVKKYIDIFKEAKITLLSLETETFALIRSLLGHDKSAVMLVEIGAITTDITIVEKGIPLLSRSLDIGGYTVTQALSAKLSMSQDRAEQFKYDLGISSLDRPGEAIPAIIKESINPIVNEIKFALNLFNNKNPAKVEKIILTGGSALLVNLPNYLTKILDIQVFLGDPWSRVGYPEELKLVLNEIGPRFAVAVGLALRSIE